MEAPPATAAAATTTTVPILTNQMKCCTSCHLYYDICMFISYNTGIEYPTCRVCFFRQREQEQVEFWRKQVNKFYECCLTFKPIILRRSNGIPYTKCNDCITLEKKAEYTKRKNQQQQQQFQPPPTPAPQ